MDYNVTYRKKDKSLQCIISYKDGGKWKQRSKQGYKTQKEFKPWIDSTLDELKDSIKTPTDYRGITFKEFSEIYLEDKKRENSYNTIANYKRAYNKFEKINDVPLTEIGYINLKPCFDRMLDEGLSESTIRIYFALMKVTLNHAIKNYEIIQKNPIDISQYKFPIKKKDNEIKALTETELNDLLSKLKGKDYFICFFAGKCGMRLGEINGLLDDGSIDFDKGVVHVERQWKAVDDKNTHELGTLKTKNSYRDVPLPVKYAPEIKKYINKCVKDINNRIFIDKTNTCTGSRLIGKFKRLGYDISIHDLRHTYVTILIKQGFDFKTISELIGDTVEMVIKTYSHFTEDMLESAKDRINKIL